MRNITKHMEGPNHTHELRKSVKSEPLSIPKEFLRNKRLWISIESSHPSKRVSDLIRLYTNETY